MPDAGPSTVAYVVERQPTCADDPPVAVAAARSEAGARALIAGLRRRWAREQRIEALIHARLPEFEARWPAATTPREAHAAAFRAWRAAAYAEAAEQVPATDVPDPAPEDGPQYVARPLPYTETDVVL